MKAVSKTRTAQPIREGWHGWDEYAPLYDWENAHARPTGRVLVRCRVNCGGPVLELGCGPAASRCRSRRRASKSLVSIGRRRCSTAPVADTSSRQGERPVVAATFAGCRSRTERSRWCWRRGILQSLTRPRDLTRRASVARVISPGGTFGLDLVPDVPNWREYRNRVQLRGRSAGGHLTLIESVKQDPTRRLTTFEQRYVERRGGRKREHRFELTFRTLTVPQMTRQLERAGCAIESVLGDYRGRPWDARADVWIILAKKV
jgi:hypothetical protein